MKTGNPPTALRCCVVCQQDTPHQLYRCEETFVRVCTRCLERALREIGVGSVESVAENPVEACVRVDLPVVGAA